MESVGKFFIYLCVVKLSCHVVNLTETLLYVQNIALRM
jgi:hypothetical protein